MAFIHINAVIGQERDCFQSKAKLMGNKMIWVNTTNLAMPSLVDGTIGGYNNAASRESGPIEARTRSHVPKTLLSYFMAATTAAFTFQCHQICDHCDQKCDQKSSRELNRIFTSSA
jgi:hypothetical protein